MTQEPPQETPQWLRERQRDADLPRESGPGEPPHETGPVEPPLASPQQEQVADTPRLTGEVQANRFCTNCGNSIPAEASFCASCGTPLGATTRPNVSQPPIAAATPDVSQVQQPSMVHQPSVLASGNVGLSDIISAMGFIGVLVVFFALPFGSDAFGRDVSTMDELGMVGDYTDVTGAAALIYALWAVPALAGLGLAIQLLTLSQGRHSSSTGWCGLLIIVALFASSGGYAALVSEIQSSFATTGGKSSTEVFFFPVTGIGNDFPGYTMMTACGAVAAISGWIAAISGGISGSSARAN